MEFLAACAIAALIVFGLPFGILCLAMWSLHK